MERPSPAVLTVMAALALPLAPGCAREVNGVQMEISRTAQHALEAGVIGNCKVQDSQWRPAETKTSQSGTVGVFSTPIHSNHLIQALLIPHPALADVHCIEEVESNWSATGTHSTLTLKRDDESNLLVVVECTD